MLVNSKPQPVTAWVNEMSAVLAALDPNHMITIGEEGFFIEKSSYTKYNPFGTPDNVTPGWAGRIGQDFLKQHASPNISYAAFHFWPANWKTPQPRFIPLWMNGHILAARQLKKPLVLEEFGKNAATDATGKKILTGPAALRSITLSRDPVYRQIYQFVEESLATDGPLRAAMFWEWGQGKRSSVNSVLSSDSTFDIIREHGAFLADRPRQIQPNCIPVPIAPASKGA